MTIDAKKLQSNLGVTADGIIGRNTLRALFQAMGASTGTAVELALSANVHFRNYGILDNGLRLAHFMAQVAHESDTFKAMEEYASGAAYEGRRDLGNTQPGDGKRFKGRGPIQITGRANYRYYGEKAGLAFEEHPEMVAYPSVGLFAGCLYWDRNNLNALADQDDVETITRRINGGLNGFDHRKALLAKAKKLTL